MQASNQAAPLRAPNGLKRRGKSTFKHLTGIYEFAPGELLLLIELCRSVDRLDAIETLLARDGMLVTGEHGQVPRAHPLLSTLAETQRTVSRLLVELQLPPLPEQRREPEAKPAPNVSVLAFS